MEHNLEPVLELERKHKIFLSHSGIQKDLVDYLYEELVRRCRTPFFDKYLSKGESFVKLIFLAIEKCKMMVVVISDDYFMSKWPMMELQAFMKDIPNNPREKYILPLFYELSVKEFRDEERRRKWVEKWKSLAKDDGKKGRIDVEAWEKAVEELGKFNGIEYNKSLGLKNYINEIVSHICDKIIPHVKWDDSHVQGKSNIFKVLNEKVNSVDHTEKYKCKTVGIVGVGGIGKTTICKVWCNKLSNEYEGRVCHIELETPTRASSSSSVQSQATSSIVTESLRKLVILLTDNNSESLVQTLNEGECINILRKSNKRKRSFIALDNIWDNHKSITQAKTILEAPKFHKETLVIVTSRSRFTLEKLGIRGDACLEMPELGKEDAMKLFLYHAAHGKQFESEEEKHDILQCIKRCYFNKGGENGRHYHPLALYSLGAQVSEQLSCVGESPSEWVRNLPRSTEGGGGNPVFDILRSSFEMLEDSELSLFMDLVIYSPFTNVIGCDFEHGGVGPSYDEDWDYEDPVERFEFEQSGDGSSWADMVEWLCLVHEVKDYKIKSTLDALKRKGLLQDADWTSGRISVHDLYMDLAELELKGMLDENRRCIKSSINDLKKHPSGGCWQELSRVGILVEIDQIINLERINWQFFSNVVVLELRGDCTRLDVPGSLDLKGLECLRSLAVINVGGLNRIEGLDSLDDLTFFKWENLRSQPDYTPILSNSHSSIRGKLPKSLIVLDVDHVWLENDVLLQCSKLQKLILIHSGVPELNLAGCSSLEIVSLKRVGKLRSLSIPCNSRGVCGLKSLLVKECWDLVEIPGLDKHIGLERLVLIHERRSNCESFRKLQLPELENFTKLKDLRLMGCKVEEAGFCIPRQLQKLFYCCDESNKAPSLRGCDQLEVLHLKLNCDLGGDEEETNLEGIQDLPALHTLMLYNCRVLAGWPDLRRSMELEVIMLNDKCDIMVHEDDIDMFKSLLVLQRVEVVGPGTLELDVFLRKWIYTLLSISREWDCHISIRSVTADIKKIFGESS